MITVAIFLERLQKLGVRLSAFGGSLVDILPEGLSAEEKAFAQIRSADIEQYLLARRMALPAYKPSQARRIVCSLTQESWFRWSGQAPAQARNDRIPFTHFFAGRSVPEAEQCLRALIARHDSLRMTFSVRDGALFSGLMDSETLPIEVVNGNEMSSEALQADLEAFHEEKIRLAEGWSLRARLYKLHKGILCALSIHHLIIDGYSLGLLKADLVREEEGRAVESKTSFLDYATHERDWFDGAGGAAVEAYWINWLRRQESLRSPGKTLLQWRPGELVVYKYKIGNTTQRRLAQAASMLRTRLFFLYMGVYATSLAEWSGQKRFALRINGSLRSSPSLLPLAGNMITADMVECDFTTVCDFPEMLRVLEAEYRAATQIRLPHLFCLPTHARAPQSGDVRMAGAIAATINYFSQRSQAGPAENPEAEEDGVAPPIFLGVHSEAWDFPVWPIYLRLIDLDDGLLCRFEFHAGQLSADECEELIRIFFSRLEALQNLC